MKWHEGDVAEAVTKVKAEAKYLFVFVKDERNTSEEWLNMLEKSSTLTNLLERCVCLQLSEGTLPFQQFSCFYKVSTIPSLHIINSEGEILEIIEGNIDENQLCDTIKSIFNVSTSESSTVSEPKIGESTSSEVIMEVVNLSNGPSEITAEQTIASIEDRMSMVKDLIAEKQRDKEEKAKEKEKQDELNRRALGKQLNKFKESQKEHEEQELRDELRRRKREEKDARDNVLRQIEEDKKERMARFSGNQQTSALPDTIKTSPRTGVDNAFARLLFRFPDGSSINEKFVASESFGVVREFVSRHIEQGHAHNVNDSFDLIQFFPRRTMTGDDDRLTIEQLQLCPSASFAVTFSAKPKSIDRVLSVPSLVSSAVGYVWLKISCIYQWFCGWLFSSGNDTTQIQQNTQQDSPETVWARRQERINAAQSRTIKHNGNFARFSDDTKKKDDEDEARWNGNSTQQM